jgi:hypothetical protein
MMHLPPTDPRMGAAAGLHAKAESQLRARRMKNNLSLNPVTELRLIFEKLARVLSLPVRIPISLFRKLSR